MGHGVSRDSLLVRPMRATELEDVIVLWHETSDDTYGFIAAERGRTLAERREYFRAQVAPRCDLWVAETGSEVSSELHGFLGIVGDYIDRMYVHPASQRRGVGSALLQQARSLSPAGLRLHTHQKNTRARAFYEKHGFFAVELGMSPPPESEPDVLYRWLPDA